MITGGIGPYGQNRETSFWNHRNRPYDSNRRTQGFHNS